MKIARLQVKEARPSTRIERVFPANIAEEDKSIFRNILSASSPRILTIDLFNASVIYSGHIILNFSDLKLVSYKDDDGEIVHLNSRDIFKIKFLWPKIRLLPGQRFLSAHSIYTHTYYHWVVEVLPRLYLLKEDIPRSVLLLPDNHNELFHAETLSLFGVKNVQFIRRGVSYFVPRMKCATQIGSHANYNPAVLREMASYVKSKVALTTNFGTRIYVSRHFAVRRKVLNEAEVEGCLNEFGFNVVYLERHTVSEQISIMHNCRYLVGIHGAGLANMIFMVPDGNVLELRKYDANTNYAFYSLATAAKHTYRYQFCRSNDPVSSVQDADVYVDIQKLRDVVQEMIQRS